MGSRDQWSSTRYAERYQLTEDNGGQLLNFVDLLNLDINTVGLQLSGLDVKRSRARLIGPGFGSHEVGSCMRTAEESHNRTKWPSSVSRFSIVV